MVIYNINLDLVKENYTSFKCKQDDDITFKLNIFNNSIQEDLNGADVALFAARSDNSFVKQVANILITNNTITIQALRDITRVPGDLKLELVIIKENKQKTTFNINGTVLSSVLTSSDKCINTVKSVIEELDEKIVDIKGTVNKAKDATDNANKASNTILALKTTLENQESVREANEDTRKTNMANALKDVNSRISIVNDLKAQVESGEKIRSDNEKVRQDTLNKTNDEISKLTTLNTNVTNQESVRQTNEDKRVKDTNDRLTKADTEVSKLISLNQDITLKENIRNKNEDDRKKNFVDMKSTIDESSVCDEGFNPDKEYKRFNKVIYLESTYQCKKDCKGVNPTDKEFWTCIAAKGRDGTGAGDMLKGDYDKNNNGIVDNAEKVNNHTVECDVPPNAKFTDTVYIHPDTHAASMITEDDTHKFITKEKLNQIDINANDIVKIKESVGVAVIISDTDVKLKENQVLFKIIQRK